jgi:hypothetical protein
MREGASHRLRAAARTLTRSRSASSTSLRPWSGCSAIRCYAHAADYLHGSFALVSPPFDRVCADSVRTWLQIAADSIEIVRREKVVGYEMSLMSQDELMELLGMTKVVFLLCLAYPLR